MAGLAKYFAKEALVNQLVVVAANLKPAKLRGIESNGMILAASKEEKVELVQPAAGTPVGERLTVEGVPSEPEAQLNPKKKILEKVLESVTTLVVANQVQVIYRDDPIKSSAGPCFVNSLVHAKVK